MDGAIADQSDIQPGVLDERERAGDRTINPVVFIAEYPAPDSGQQYRSGRS